eukprot:1146288-Pelagomonas_calceolata.AAC.5
MQAPGTAPVDTNFISILLAPEPMDLHNSSCNGMFNLCSNDGVSCCMDREVKARNFADAMWSRTCTPCPSV